MNVHWDGPGTDGRLVGKDSEAKRWRRLLRWFFRLSDGHQAGHFLRAVWTFHLILQQRGFVEPALPNSRLSDLFCLFALASRSSSSAPSNKAWLAGVRSSAPRIARHIGK